MAREIKLIFKLKLWHRYLYKLFFFAYLFKQVFTYILNYYIYLFMNARSHMTNKKNK